MLAIYYVVFKKLYLPRPRSGWRARRSSRNANGSKPSMLNSQRLVYIFMENCDSGGTTESFCFVWRHLYRFATENSCRAWVWFRGERFGLGFEVLTSSF